jgi:hypothetical protein
VEVRIGVARHVEDLIGKLRICREHMCGDVSTRGNMSPEEISESSRGCGAKNEGKNRRVVER